jgi:hypothetical protein
MLWSCTYQITCQFVNTPINLYIPQDRLSTFHSYQRLHTRRCILSTHTPYNRQHINYSIPEVAYFNSHKTAESKYSQPHGSRRNRIIDQHTYKMGHIHQLANTRTDMLPTCIYCETAVAYSHSQLQHSLLHCSQFTYLYKPSVSSSWLYSATEPGNGAVKYCCCMSQGNFCQICKYTVAYKERFFCTLPLQYN